MVDIAPCLDEDKQTYCQRLFLKKGGNLPCPLWEEGRCRPRQSKHFLAIHLECPITLLEMYEPTDEELAIKKAFIDTLIRHR